jgi:molybdopterin/thiamine biosynthesis adenylyltransferase
VLLAATSPAASQARYSPATADQALDTFDDAAFDRFRSGLINEGFSPVEGAEESIWTGPIRPSLRPLTDATRMKIQFYPGWPLRYAHVVIDGLAAEHAARGIICLWAEDDPAQIRGRDLAAVWDRLDAWAVLAQQGFRSEDRALDAYLLFSEQNTYQAELPLAEIIRKGSNGYLAQLFATRQGQCVLVVEAGAPPDPAPDEKPRLQGVFYLRSNIGSPPRNLDDVRSALTRRQAQDLERGLTARAPAGLAETSGGYDFIVLAWPRHGREHDAVVVGFQGAGDALRASAMSATPNDTAARQRRAGPDVDLLCDKTVLIAGAGSVGGHVAVALASSGVGTIHLHDSDYLKSGNLVRHVSSGYLVGYEKTFAVSIAIEDHAPWTTVKRYDDLPYDPPRLSRQVERVDLVIDCTGLFPLSAALAEVCRRNSVPLITGALYHQGSLARVQRQADGDCPIAARSGDAGYCELPPDDLSEPDSGFLELGCTAPINKAPPLSVLSAAAEIASAATDFLTGRRERPDERVIVFRAMNPPFDRIGTLDPPQPRGKESV